MLTGAQLADFCGELIADVYGPDQRADALKKAFATKLTAIRVRTAALGRTSAVPIPPAPVVLPPTPEKPFDPYAFSVVALMSKKGREALATRLAAIDSNAHLVQLAEAQGLEIDPPAVDGTGEAINKLRDAILAAAERRIANRRAAAS